MAPFPAIDETPLQIPLRSPVTFERFMEHCLYARETGYYHGTRARIFGRKGDFLTSPHTHPLFAQCLAESLKALFLQLESPRPFVICELGAGDGTLADQLGDYLGRVLPEMWEVVEYVEIDLDRGGIPDAMTGVVFSNEFFDALPVHRVRVEGDALREVFVVQEGARFVELAGALSDPRLEDFLTQAFTRLEPGWTYEVNLRMLDALEVLDRKISRGMLLTIDYGYTQVEYLSMPRPGGTLTCYRGHELSDDPYRFPGEQDMTCHIHWDMFMQKGRSLGWKNRPLMRQRDFLIQHGLEQELRKEEALGMFSADRLQERLRLKELLVPGGLSDALQVLIQEIRLS